MQPTTTPANGAPGAAAPLRAPDTPKPWPKFRAAPPDEVLDGLTRRLNALGRASSLEQARATGLLLVDLLYGGDLAAWRARGRKEVGYRRLVARRNGGGLSVPASALSRALALVTVEARLGFASWPAGLQVFDSLQLEGPTLSAAHSPLLDVERSSNTVFRNLRITLGAIDTASGDVPAAVRVRNAVGVKFIGGALQGASVSGTVGLLFTAVGEASFTDGAHESGATGMRIERFGWGFRLDATVDEPCFIDCTFADNVDGAVLITRPSNPTPRVRNPSSTATGMRLISCRMLGGAPQQYLLVDGGVNSRSDNWFGGTILGCTFGAPPPAEGTQVAGKRATGTPASCILRVLGSVQGIVVAGCRSYHEDGRSSVWIFGDPGSVSRSADTFNSWAQTSIASGDAAGDLVIFDAAAVGALTVQTEQQRFDTGKVGFFDATPNAPASGYDVTAVSPSTTLSSITAPQVLAQLITDLTLLGVLKKT